MEVLAMGRETGKPAYSLIWQRYHDFKKSTALELINLQEFESHVLTTAETKVSDGKKINEIIWWSSDYYFFKR
jgi:hypothetical protein